MIMTADRIAEVLYDSEAALRAIDREVVTLRVPDAVRAPAVPVTPGGCAEPPAVPDFEA